MAIHATSGGCSCDRPVNFQPASAKLDEDRLDHEMPSSADKRISVLGLTEEGQKVALAIQRDMEAHLEEIFSHMTEFEQDMVLQSIKLLNEAMAKSSVCCKPMY